MFKSRILVLFLAVVLLAGCSLTDRKLSITGSGNVVTREENITGFDKVDITTLSRLKSPKATPSA